MAITRPAKGHYSEPEAAHELGLTVEEFRGLVRKHIVETDEDLEKLRITGIQPADLVLLRLLRSTSP